MLNLLITALIIIVLCVSFFWGPQKSKAGEGFFNKEYTNTLKGLFSIIVIFVHIPEAYQNPLQDATGSFAYVAVTGFFMISAYGMQYSIERNPRYLNIFPVNRASGLIIPNLLVNFICLGALMVVGEEIPKCGFFKLNGYVIVLLEYCLAFYIVNLIRRKYPFSNAVYDFVLIFVVCVSSLWIYLSESGGVTSGWCYERLGLVWGLLLYRHYEKFKKWLQCRYVVKFLVFGFLGAILGVLYLKYKPIWFWGEYLLKIVLGLELLIFLGITTIKFMRSNRMTDFLGRISYETYLSHGFIAILLTSLFPQMSSGFFIICLIASTLLFSYLAHLINRPLVEGCKRLLGRF